MTDTVLFILEIVGTAVFAASGALAGLQRQLDAFGVVILGVCTACGGGVIRDLTLGITPPVMFCQPAMPWWPWGCRPWCSCRRCGTCWRWRAGPMSW